MTAHRRNWKSDLQNKAEDFLKEHAEYFTDEAADLFLLFAEDVNSEVEDLKEELNKYVNKVEERDSVIDELKEEVTNLEQRIDDLESQE